MIAEPLKENDSYNPHANDDSLNYMGDKTFRYTSNNTERIQVSLKIIK